MLLERMWEGREKVTVVIGSVVNVIIVHWGFAIGKAYEVGREGR